MKTCYIPYVSSVLPAIRISQYDSEIVVALFTSCTQLKENTGFSTVGSSAPGNCTHLFTMIWGERPTHLPQDPPFHAISSPPYALAFSNRAAFFSKCSFPSANYMDCLRGQGHPGYACSSLGVWGGFRKRVQGVRLPEGKTWVWQALKGSSPEVRWWDVRYSGIVCKTEQSYWVVITSEILIESLKVYEMRDPRIPIFDLYHQDSLVLCTYEWSHRSHTRTERCGLKWEEGSVQKTF